MKIKQSIVFFAKPYNTRERLIIQLDFEGVPGRKLDSDTVEMIVRRLNLDMAEYWAGAWRDDDSPLQETATGTCRRAS